MCRVTPKPVASVLAGRASSQSARKGTYEITTAVPLVVTISMLPVSPTTS